MRKVKTYQHLSEAMMLIGIAGIIAGLYMSFHVVVPLDMVIMSVEILSGSILIRLASLLMEYTNKLLTDLLYQQQEKNREMLKDFRELIEFLNTWHTDILNKQDKDNERNN